jgi:aminoglycoside phosphotransferase family enzyme/predicted kinase
MPTTDSAALVSALARALDAQLIETHISWVLLAGELAYKIKKPVKLPFVDYGTLQARQHFCEEEVRLNGRLASTLYLGVTSITGTPQAPVLDGPGPVLEYAVRMRRFPPGALFSEKLAAGILNAEHVDGLAALLADFHEQAARADAASGFASAVQRQSSALQALEGVQAVASPAEQARLSTWLKEEGARLAPGWASRLTNGRVRECHGDLHLANVIALDDSVAAFDGIEFDPALRWIDVFDDVAFVVMDLFAQGRRDLAFRFLNAWLDRTGDHEGLPVLRFSVVYRALVRAMVARLSGADDVARRYLDAALAWTRSGDARLFITHGLPGSGKTFTSQRLLEQEGAIRLRSDVERKRLFGLGLLEDSHAKGLNLYDAQASARTYAHLFNMARMVLRAGYPVILDAAFLRRAERTPALALARELAVPLTIVNCEAPLAILQSRLRARQGDASEADVAVLEKLREVVESLAGEELALAQTPEQLIRSTPMH